MTAGLYEHVVKRFIDTAAAACLLLLLVPLMAVVWLAVVWVLGSPAL